MPSCGTCSEEFQTNKSYMEHLAGCEGPSSRLSSRAASRASRSDIKERILAEGARIKSELKDARRELSRVREESASMKEFYMEQAAVVADERDELRRKLSQLQEERVNERESLRSEFRKKLDAEKRKSSSDSSSQTVARLTATIDNLRDEIADSDRIRDSLQAQIMEKESIIRAKMDELNEYARTSKKVAEERVSELNRVRAAAEEDKELLRNRLEADKIREVGQMGDEVRRLENLLAQVNSQLESDHRVHQSALAENASGYVTSLKEKDDLISHIKEAHRLEIEHIQSMGDGRLREAIRAKEADMAAAIADNERKTHDLERVHSNALSSMQEEMNKAKQETEEAIRQTNRDAEKRVKECENAMAKMEERMSARLMEKEAEGNQEMHRREIVYNEEISRRDVMLKESEDIIASLKKELLDLKSKLDSETDERERIREQFANNLKQQKEDAELEVQERDTLISELRKNISELHREMTIKTDELREVVETERRKSADLQVRVVEEEVVRKGWDLEMRTVTDKLQSEFAAKLNEEAMLGREALETERRRHSKEMSEMETRMHNMDLAAAIKEKEMVSRISEIELRHKAEIAELNRTFKEKEEAHRWEQLRLTEDSERKTRDMEAQITSAQQRAELSETALSKQNKVLGEQRVMLDRAKEEFEYKMSIELENHKKVLTDIQKQHEEAINEAKKESQTALFQLKSIRQEFSNRVNEEIEKQRIAAYSRLVDVEKENAGLREEIKKNCHEFSATMSEQAIRAQENLTAELNKVKASHQEELNAEKAKVAHLRAETERLRHEFSSKMSEHSISSNDILTKELAKAKVSFKEELDAEKAKVAMLTGDIDRLRDEFSMAVKEQSERTQDNLTKELKRTKDCHKEELDAEKGKVASLIAEIEKIRNEHSYALEQERLAGDIRMKKAEDNRMKEHNDEMKRLRQNAEILEAELRGMRAEFINTLTQSTSQRSAREDELLAIITQKDRDINELKSQMDIMAGEFTRRLNEMTKATREKNDAAIKEIKRVHELELKKKDAIYYEAKRDWDNAKASAASQMMKMHRETEENKEKLRSLEEEMLECAAKLNDAKADVTLIKQEYAEYKEETIHIKKKCDEYEDKINATNIEYGAYKKEAQDKIEELIRTHQILVNELESKMRDMEQDFTSKLEDSYAKLEDNELKKNVDTAVAIANEKEREINAIRASLSNIENEAYTLKQAAVAKEMEIERQATRIRELEALTMNTFNQLSSKQN